MTTIQHPAPMPATPGQRAHLTDAQLATLLQGWGVSMVTDLDHDPAAAHLVGYGAGGARACEGVQHEIAWLGRNFRDLFDQSFRLRGSKWRSRE